MIVFAAAAALKARSSRKTAFQVGNGSRGEAAVQCLMVSKLGWAGGRHWAPWHGSARTAARSEDNGRAQVEPLVGLPPAENLDQCSQESPKCCSQEVVKSFLSLSLDCHQWLHCTCSELPPSECLCMTSLRRPLRDPNLLIVAGICLQKPILSFWFLHGLIRLPTWWMTSEQYWTPWIQGHGSMGAPLHLTFEFYPCGWREAMVRAILSFPFTSGEVPWLTSAHDVLHSAADRAPISLVSKKGKSLMRVAAASQTFWEPSLPGFCSLALHTSDSHEKIQKKKCLLGLCLPHVNVLF